ncbi:hypothetical protein O7606_23105 [Micromonospora sp. WMMD882]|uniref:hypothetical protein n=1 Tax=Micromonospora sp. WMMD882 TaxID=3015151 RepID=UPI00248C2C4F|nr:hypothetical protein [Micromonospora sp. WMMD882]WBB79044.1 hypothetical protein O7606_23105 [Micromonospora sp. WMMD882]
MSPGRRWWAAGWPGRAGPASRSRLVGLAVAVAAGSALVTLPEVDSRPVDPAGRPGPERRVEQEWPRAVRGALPARLADGTAYSPVWFLDAVTSLGTAPSPDGRSLRLLLRAADGTPRELRRLPADGAPQYAGLAVAGADVAWAETTTGRDGRGRTELWTVNPGSGRPARRLTSDPGDVLFFNSRHDMLIEAGRLWWVAAPDSDAPATEVRSVALAGGPVDVRAVPGGWALSTWPWLVSVGAGAAGPVTLRSLTDGVERRVSAGPAELLTCGPTWCRALVPAGAGPGRIDLVRADGRDRHRVAGPDGSAALIDVAVRDRFEVLLRTGPGGVTGGGQQLRLWDVTRRRAVTVADGVGLVLCRGDVLWWSTGTPEVTAWHTLDLGSLT